LAQIYALLLAGFTPREVGTKVQVGEATVIKYRDRVSNLLTLAGLLRQVQCPNPDCGSVIPFLLTAVSVRCDECRCVFDLSRTEDLRASPPLPAKNDC
jgi:hypothetical protein